MKTNLFLLTLITFFVPFSFVNAQSSETVKVWGNCGMCKKTIETAAKKGGALTAEWNKDTKMLTFTTSDKSGNLKVQQAVAAAGYDTRDLTGDNAAYEKLPGCCHYDRKAATSATAEKAGAKHESCGKADCKDCKDHAAKMDCCKEGKCDGKTACKDKAACKEKGCEGKDCCKS